VGRASARANPPGFRRQVLKLVRGKYGGEEGERFGLTLATEHLASQDRMQIDAETLRQNLGIEIIAAGSPQAKGRMERTRGPIRTG